MSDIESDVVVQEDQSVKRPGDGIQQPANKKYSLQSLRNQAISNIEQATKQQQFSLKSPLSDDGDDEKMNPMAVSGMSSDSPILSKMPTSPMSPSSLSDSIGAAVTDESASSASHHDNESTVNADDADDESSKATFADLPVKSVQPLSHLTSARPTKAKLGKPSSSAIRSNLAESQSAPVSASEKETVKEKAVEGDGEQESSSANSTQSFPSKKTFGGFKLVGLGAGKELKKTTTPSSAPSGGTSVSSGTSDKSSGDKAEFLDFRSKLKPTASSAVAAKKDTDDKDTSGVVLSKESDKESGFVKSKIDQQQKESEKAAKIPQLPPSRVNPVGKINPAASFKAGAESPVPVTTPQRQVEVVYQLKKTEPAVASSKVLSNVQAPIRRDSGASKQDSGSSADLSALRAKLKNVSSNSRSPSKDSLSGSSSDLAEMRSRLKSQTSGTSTSSAQKTAAQSSNVPEFLAMRNKLKSSGAAGNTSVATLSQNASTSDVTASNASLSVSQPVQSTAKGQYSRFGSGPNSSLGSSSGRTSPDKPQSTYTYKAPTLNASASNQDFKSVQLRGSKNDTFVNAAGGSIRPKVPLLMVVKGKKKVSLQVLPLQLKSLNQTDAFILDMSPAHQLGSNMKEDPERPLFRLLFVLSGEKTSRVRRTKAIELANLVKDKDYGGRAEIALVEMQNIKERTVQEKEFIFWQTVAQQQSLPSKNDIVEQIKDLSVSSNEDDVQFESYLNDHISAYKWINNNAQKVVSSGKELKHSILNSSDVVIVDCASEIYVWSGKNANEQDKSGAMKFAEDLASKKSGFKPQVLLEGERFERVMFKSKFEDWPTIKEVNVGNVLEVKAMSNIKAKDKEWRVYDRGADIKKSNTVDIMQMYDKYSSANLAIVKNTEALDIDSSELIKRDWGFSRLRVWGFKDVGNQDVTKQKLVQVDKKMLTSMERQFSESKPFVFNSRECYIMLYEFKERPPKMADKVLAEKIKINKEDIVESMRDSAVLYTWAGQDSSVSDQAFMAHICLEVEKMTHDGRLDVLAKARHIRVNDGKEPVHFLNMIRGGNIPRDQPQRIQDMLPKAAVAPSPAVIVERESNISSPLRVFHSVSTMEDNCRVVELYKPDANMLSSLHSFVVLTKSKAYVWYGKGSFEWERKAAQYAAKSLADGRGLSVVECEEASEQSDFWKSFNLSSGASAGYDSSSTYSSRKNLKTYLPFAPEDALSMASTVNSTDGAPYDSRLWKINYFVNGNPTATEICPYTTTDLQDDCVYIMDTYFNLFVWIGAQVGRKNVAQSPLGDSSAKKAGLDVAASKNTASGFRDIRLAIETAQKYAEYVGGREDGRLSDKNSYVLQSGAETGAFKVQFGAWQEQPRNPDNWPSGITLREAVHYINEKKYSLTEIKGFVSDKATLPFGVDLEKLESYVNASDFEKVFGMSYEKYSSLPQWKQTELKKKSGLY
ncbi:hypothetical protein MP228_012526 [Amoeboaphelidium protococcarum]|nr:hypothetical protein MP228_012526 [Amoeboaphelidium protococcarum]